MAIDRLIDKIRKIKNPVVVDFSMLPEHIPAQILEQEGAFLPAYSRYCCELLEELKDSVPAVRFSFGIMACLGAEGLDTLAFILRTAKKMGYYVLLDGAESFSDQTAKWYAEHFFSANCPWHFDGLVLSAYIGSDALREYSQCLQENGKDIFAVVRTANRSAPEVQDLLTGSRLVHLAKAEIVNRFAQQLPTKCAYSRIGIVAGASSADSIRTLRTKFRNMFMLLDGMDYPNANAKNCSFAFDELGRGAAACVGISVTAAWQREDCTDYLAEATAAVERHRKNISRYISMH